MQQQCRGLAGPQSDRAGVPVVGAVGRNAVVALVVEAVHFCSSGVVLCGHHCHFAGPVVSVYVPFFVSPGSWTSSSPCGVNLVSVFAGFMHQC